MSQRNSRIRRSKKAKNRLGAAVVEFAIVAPVMIMMTMGMMEIGRVVMVKQMLVNASREGARLAVLPDSSTSDVTTYVGDVLNDQGIMGATVTTSPTEISNVDGGTIITVDIGIPASSVSWIPNPVFTGNSTLSATTTMRRESK